MIPSHEVLLNMVTYSRLYLEDRIITLNTTGDKNNYETHYRNELKEIDDFWGEYLKNKKRRQ